MCHSYSASLRLTALKTASRRVQIQRVPLWSGTSRPATMTPTSLADAAGTWGPRGETGIHVTHRAVPELPNSISAEV